jgi:hypothetical protein
VDKYLVWEGIRKDGETTVRMSSDEELWANVPFYLDEVNHASEFNWGYWGSGPAQLGYAILRTYFEIVYSFSPTEAHFQAYKYHQNFKADFISAWKTDTWLLTCTEIDLWLGGEKAGWF